MKHNKHLFTVICAAVLLSSAVPFAGTAVEQPRTVQADEEITDMSQPEDFDAITGHDYQHPIWPTRSLGVIVLTNNPTFLQQVREACEAWSPAFNLVDYGYVKPGTRINTEHGRLHFVYVSDVDLSESRAEENNDKNGDTIGVDPYDTDANGYFKMPYVRVRVDSAWNKEAFGTYADPYVETVSVLEHELGHAIGMRHSTDKNDVLYTHDLDNMVQPNELAAVERLYRGVPDGDYPSTLPIVHKRGTYSITVTFPAEKTGASSSTGPTKQAGQAGATAGTSGQDASDGSDSEDGGDDYSDYSGDSISRARNSFYMKHKSPNSLINKIDAHVYAISNGRTNLWYRANFDYTVVKHGRNYSHRHYLPNGTYRVHFMNYRLHSLKKHAGWRWDRLIFGTTDADIGDHVYYKQQLKRLSSFWVRPHRHTASGRLSFALTVHVHGRHFYISR